MLAFISPLDADYIALKWAAHLIAREYLAMEAVDVMQAFTHAIFSGEFERDETAIPSLPRNDERNYPQLFLDAPPPKIEIALHLPPESRPHEYLGVTALTVADVLGERGLLPGDAEGWEKFTALTRDDNATDKTLEALACIPYVAFPAEAQRLLGNILLARPKLIAWMKFKGYRLPKFLAPDEAPQNDARVVIADILARARTTATAPADTPPKPDQSVVDPATEDLRGRPPKPGWKRVCELVRAMHATNPKTQHNVLAYDAHAKAKLEFDEKDLPSVKTIIRQMKNILGSDI